MIDLQTPETDDKIRSALKDANRKGKLEIVAAVTGTSDSELRRIMNSSEPLTMMERVSLGMHLGD